jgi:hypothetical protein
MKWYWRNKGVVKEGKIKSDKDEISKRKLYKEKFGKIEQ